MEPEIWPARAGEGAAPPLFERLARGGDRLLIFKRARCRWSLQKKKGQGKNKNNNSISSLV